MTTRTLEQIKKDYDEVQNKIILFSNDLSVLRNELDILVKDDTIDIITGLDKKLVLYYKLEKFNQQLNELGIKKLILIEEYRSQQ